MTLSVSFSVDITTGFSICSFNEFIYVIGGCYLGDYIKSVKSFNTITYMWSDICDMNVEKHNAGKIFIWFKFGVNIAVDRYSVLMKLMKTT